MRYVALALICIAFRSSAQETKNKPSRFFYGVTVSPILTKMQFVDAPSNSSFKNNLKPGISAGAEVKYIQSKHFFVVGGVTYSSAKSEMIQDNYTSFDLSGLSSAQLISQYNFNWIGIPLNINYILNPTSKAQVFIGAGVTAKKLLSTRMILTLNRMEVSTNSTVSATNEISTQDYFKTLNAFGSLTSGVQFLGKYNDALILSLSIDRNLFELAKPPNKDPNSLFNYGYQVQQQRLTNFSLNLSYFIR